jgi:DNA-binding response OmpR family regulator
METFRMMEASSSGRKVLMAFADRTQIALGCFAPPPVGSTRTDRPWLVRHRLARSLSYKVQISHSVADAVKAIEEKPFDVYLLDYKLPDGSGLDLAERIRSKGSEVPILLISGYDPASIALRAEKLGISITLEKPFSREVIVRAVKNAIGHRRPILCLFHKVREPSRSVGT